MNMIDKYLQELFGFGKAPSDEVLLMRAGVGIINPNDPSLPNPYNFRQIKLDPNVTKADIQKAKKFWSAFDIKHGVEKGEDPLEVAINNIKKEGGKVFTIVDKGKKVGIVGGPDKFIYVTWTPGKNYATSGVMKFLDSEFPHYSVKNGKLQFKAHYIYIQDNNIVSQKVMEHLKVKYSAYSPEWHYYTYVVKAPYWWNNNKVYKN